jgi:pimeloyl-ACP methyl ester carboxylesterase
MSVRAASGFADVPGGRLWYEDLGEGPAVVLIHAGIADARMWERQMATFTTAFRTVRFDMRAFGRSPVPTAPFSPVDDVLALMDALSIDRAALVGNSFGGAVATEAALAHPDRVWAVALVAPALFGFEGEGHPTLEAAGAAREAGDVSRSVDLELEVWAPLRTDPEVDALIHRWAHDNDGVDDLPEDLFLEPEPLAAARLEELRAPTLVVMGDTNPPDFEAIAEEYTRRVPGARAARIADADHLASLRGPEEFDRVVLEFLRDASEGEAPATR